jgi:uncharacterized protein (DUF433 family)
MARKKTTSRSDPLKKIEGRLRHVEEMLQEALSFVTSHKVLEALASMPSEKVSEENLLESRETPTEPWRFLVRRQHPWRKQLYVKGRNMTARQLVGSIKANQFDDEKAAANFHLPIDAIREALVYVEKNIELLQTEAEIERLMHKREGATRGAQPVP